VNRRDLRTLVNPTYEVVEIERTSVAVIKQGAEVGSRHSGLSKLTPAEPTYAA
jgi:hypothetical protein